MNALHFRILLLCAIFALTGTPLLRAQNVKAVSDGQVILQHWKAGQTVSKQEVNRFGIGNCFTESEINDALFARIKGKSFREDCTLPRPELRYLKVLHCNPEGEIMLGEMICNRAIAGDLLEIFRTLYEARYPIGRMVLIDEYGADDRRSMTVNNSSSFNFRFIAGTRHISKHGKGMAVDINPLFNPCVRTRTGKTVVEPAAGAPYADRTKEFPCKIDENDLCYKEFIRHGFEWGGHWRSLKDYQHFEKRE